MKHIVVDPMTRIEGHLRLEANYDEATGKITDAISSGTSWRGLELILQDRDPRDAWAFMARICGVCSNTHSLASLYAVEDALGIEIPKNGMYIRNIMLSSQIAHDHSVHFYNLHALDWVSPVHALDADPALTAETQNLVLEEYDASALNSAPRDGVDSDSVPHEFPKATTAYFASVQERVKELVDSGQLSIFAANWWDHPDYDLLTPEVHLMAVSHYINILDRQSDIVIPQVIFGGKNPHPHYIVGGMPCSISMDDGNAPVNSARLSEVDNAINLTHNIVNYFYLPDLLAIGKAYVDAGKVDGAGAAGKSALSFGNYPTQPHTGVENGDYFEKCLVRSHGVVQDFDKGVEKATFVEFTGEDLFNSEFFSEAVDSSWFEYPGDEDSLNPIDGVTEPAYDGGTKFDSLIDKKKYSWVKTPLFQGNITEVGPCATYIVCYTKVKQGIIKNPTWAEQMIVDQIDTVSDILGVKPHEWLPSTLGRTAARALDAQLACNVERYFFDLLIANIKAGDTAVANMDKFDPENWPKEEVSGVGIIDACRGALGHWVRIKDSKISLYEAIVPTTWNAAPKDKNGNNGPYELAIINTHIHNPDSPLEIAKAIRSFDPCLACAAHLYDADGQEITTVST